MKMRKRIAALLAVAMVAALMPMTAFAKSTNSLTHEVIHVAKGGKNVTQGQELKIALTDGVKKDNVFRVELVGAEWDQNVATTVSTTAGIRLEKAGAERAANVPTEFTVSQVSDNTLEFVRTGGTLFGTNNEVLTIPIKAVNIVGDKDGKASVKVDGWNAPVSDTETVFATTSTAKASVTVGDATTFYNVKSKIAKIKIEESAVGSFANATGKTFEVDLYNTDYEFKDLVTTQDAAKYSMGFYGASQNAITLEYGKLRNGDDDLQKVVFTVESAIPTTTNNRGVYEFELYVDSIDRRPISEELEATISGDLVEKQTAVVANIVKHGVEIKPAEDYEFYAGRVEKVKFTLSETVLDSIASGRYTDFTFPAGVSFDNSTIKCIDKNTGLSVPVISTPKENRNGEKVYEQFTVENFNVDTSKADEYEFEAELHIASSFEGDITLATDGRAFENIEAKIATVKPALEVTIEPMTVTEGLKSQIGGKIVIKELIPGALNRGQDIVLQLEDDKFDSIKFNGAKFTVVEGDALLMGDTETTKSVLEKGIKRASKKASTIEVTDIDLRLDRTVPEGSYNLSVGGGAISELVMKDIQEFDAIIGKDFLFVGKKYTRPVTVFTIGSNTFTVNGEPRVMDASSYLKEGRTMVPVRYLAYALGIPEEAIKYNAGVVTIIDDSKVIQVTRGSNELVVNGMVIPMETSAENSKEDGRAYVPFKDIGAVFGVTGHWDPVAQTATFK